MGMLTSFIADCIAFGLTGSTCNPVKPKESKKDKKNKKAVIKLLQRMK